MAGEVQRFYDDLGDCTYYEDAQAVAHRFVTHFMTLPPAQQRSLRIEYQKARDALPRKPVETAKDDA